MNISMSLNLKGTKENTTKKGGGRLAKKKKSYLVLGYMYCCIYRVYFTIKLQMVVNNFILNDSS